MNINEIIEQMTLEEKIQLCSGRDFWHTESLEQYDLPAIMMSDGPHGLRKQEDAADHLGVNKSIEATCFPSAAGLACSFDRELIGLVGETLGDECQAEGVAILLGPGANIKRSPLCGRNFEYFSEDPYLTGELAGAYINGVQSKNIGTSLKHFAVNNQEYERLVSSSEIDERTLREVYLTGFEMAVKNAKPWTVMCSYNRINGIYASEHKRLLGDVLKEEWQFEGAVISDWGAVSDRVKGLLAGMDLEMPGCQGLNDEVIREAVSSGVLPMKALDDSVKRILTMIRSFKNGKYEVTYDREEHHAVAIEIAKRSLVLLKNESVLPLKKDTDDLLIVGGFAEKPRYQGGGSSHVNAYKVTDFITAANEYAAITYAKGFPEDSDEWLENEAREAIEEAKTSGTVVVFAGLPELFESEGYDRTHMALPDCQNRLINELCQVNERVIIILQNGSPVEMPWVNDVEAILECYLGGEGVAEGVWQVLFGDYNPSGKLAESFPLKLSDTPAYLNYGGYRQKTYYNEGIYVGYRYYDSRDLDVLFPFGHGLSYTTFEHDNLDISQRTFNDTDTVMVSIDILNTGQCTGREIVQLYVRDKTNQVQRPLKELKGFESVLLEPGETKKISFALDKRSFAYYETTIEDWYVPSGIYEVMVGSSSRDIRDCIEVKVLSTTELPWVIDQDTKLGLLLEHSKTRQYCIEHIMPEFEAFTKALAGSLSDNLANALLNARTIRSLRSFSGISNARISKMVADLNGLLVS